MQEIRAMVLGSLMDHGREIRVLDQIYCKTTSLYLESKEDLCCRCVVELRGVTYTAGPSVNASFENKRGIELLRMRQRKRGGTREERRESVG
jgi:hypothetical protein